MARSEKHSLAECEALHVEGMAEVQSPSFRFVSFPGQSAQPLKTLVYVALLPEDLPSGYDVLLPDLLQARIPHRHFRFSGAPVAATASPAWTGKLVTLYLSHEDSDLLDRLDALLANSGCRSGPPPTTRCRLVGPSSGMLFSRHLDGLRVEPTSLRRRKLSDLLEWTGGET